MLCDSRGQVPKADSESPSSFSLGTLRPQTSHYKEAPSSLLTGGPHGGVPANNSS